MKERDSLIDKGNARRTRLMKLCLAAALLASCANVALGQSAPAPSTPSENAATKVAKDEGLSWHGITLYGIIDIGFQYENHGAPFSDYHPAGSANIVQKYSRQSAEGLTPSNLSQSRIGLQGVEPLGLGDLQGIFRLETFFNPQSGDLSDAQKSQVQNNGKAVGAQTTNLNSSVAGEAFESAYAGFASKTFGSITFGRQLTLVADGVSKYDPNYGSQAFSLIGMSGTYAGAGDTEDKRVDNSLKYSLTVLDIGRFAAFYKFNNSNSAAATLWQFDAGADYAGASVDLYFDKTRDGISNSPLSAAQVTGLPLLGYSITNSLSATVSDNTVGSLMGSYTFGPLKFLGGYEYLQYDNPKDKLAAGFVDIGGYVEAYVSNTAYPHPKILNLYWAGARYTVLPGLDLTSSFYGYHQNSYGIGEHAHCESTVAGTCAGTFKAFSLDADYAFTKRFDAYLGAMWSEVAGGVANGYLYQRTNINPTIGVRFKF